MHKTIITVAIIVEQMITTKTPTTAPASEDFENEGEITVAEVPSTE